MNRTSISVADGAELSVIVWNEHGSSVPVLLVHGLASNARLWDGVAAELASSGHPVAALDQRGHGLSTKPDQGYDFHTMAADLVSVIGAMGWNGPPVVAGQSMGGNVVLHLSASHPSAARGLVLVDGGTIDLSARFADWQSASSALAPPALAGMRAVDFEESIRKAHPDWPEEGINGTLANVEVGPDGTIRPRLSREHHMLILRAMWEQKPASLYPKVIVPVALVMARGGADKTAQVDRAATALGNASVHWLSGDHDLHAQHPSLVASVISGMA